jgi:membrane protease YdiL (CAAX protease family)
VAGVVTFLLVSLLGDAVILYYRAVGIEQPPVQRNVDVAGGAFGLDALSVFAAAAFTAPFAEEVFYRGVFFPAVARVLTVPRALVVQAAVFGFVHVLDDPARWPLAAPLAAVGLAMGWLYHRTGSILVPILAHIGFNVCNLVVIRLGA